MKRNKITAFLLSAVMTMSIASPTIHAADTALKKSDYQYFLNNDNVTAYVEMGEKINSKNIDFIDGIAQGITDPSDPLYNELVTLDGLDSRKQYAANSFYFTINDGFYEEGDTEVLFSVAYYDFGPSPGQFYFEYHSIDGTLKKETITKPYTTPGWNVRTICVDDIDLSAKYENGATIRFENRVYNAFRKLEAVNVTKARREKQEVNLTCLGNDVMLELDDLCILDVDDKDYMSKNLADSVTEYDVQKIINIITNNQKGKNNGSRQKTLTQGQLLEMFMNAAGIEPEFDETVFDAAMRVGITAKGLFLYEEAPATKFNLLWAAYNSLVCANPKDGNSLLANLIADGYYDSENVDEIESAYFKNLYHKSDSSEGGAYDYFLNTDKHSASITLAENIEENGIEFINKNETYTGYPDFNKLMTYDGLPGRKQGGNSLFKLSDEFYEEGDTEFLISVVFYDFGPARGSFTLNYTNTDGGTSSITHIKPGTNPGWYVRTAIVSDMDPSAIDSNGATFYFYGGAVNAFRKIEVLNISRARREGWDLDVTCLGNDIILNSLSDMYLADLTDSRFTNANLSSNVTAYDTQDMINAITGSTAKNTASQTITYNQGDLVTKFLNLLGISKESGESAVDAAYRVGIAQGTLLTKDLAPASLDDMLRLAYNALTYLNPSTNRMLLDDLIKNGYYDDKDMSTITSSIFTQRYYNEPRYLPYTTLVDQGTGRSYQFIDLFGGVLIRPYFTSPCWLPDGVSFLCGTQTGIIYIYNTETQMLTYVDEALPNTGDLQAAVWGHDIYYTKKSSTGNEIWRVDPDDLSTKRCIFKLPQGVNGFRVSVTDDGVWGSIDLDPGEAYVYTGNPVYRRYAAMIVRINFETGETDWVEYEFPNHRGYGNHQQMNPRYGNLVSFVHEGFGETPPVIVSDRHIVYDFDTGEFYQFSQGSEGDEMTYERGLYGSGHDYWSFDGEYRTTIGGSGSRFEDYEGEDALRWGVMMYEKDGTHPRFFKAPYGSNHGTLSFDNKMFVADSHTNSLISTETHQAFEISGTQSVLGYQGHPRQAHVTMSGYNYKFAWAIEHNGVLGCAWFDYTDIMENEVAKGGFYPIGEGLSRISYEGLECESKETVMAGEECVVAHPGCWLFVDVNRDYLDSDNCDVKITFDYYDNTTEPIELKYSKGLQEYNDFWKLYTESRKIQRTGTNEWKTAELTINKIRLESVGKFASDFKISASTGSLYVKNLKIERIDTENDNS